MSRALASGLILVFLVACRAEAHRLEPINTEFASPFDPGTGNVQIGYEYLRTANFFTRQQVPVLQLEYGFAPRFQFAVEFPVLRNHFRGEPAQTGAGNTEFSLRYLLAGGQEYSYALSINAVVEAPTGDRAVAEHAVTVGGRLHFDKSFGESLFAHFNVGYLTSVSRFDEKEKSLEYSAALVWAATLRWNPGFEVVGRKQLGGESNLGLIPELIYYVGPHMEVKFGLPVGVTSTTPDIGFQAQVAIIFGKGGTR